MLQGDQVYVRGIERLVAVVQDLSRARALEDIQVIVRSAARLLTGADGATFVLRDGEKCFYADEDAIAPLWKGMRFPLSACISGWAMLNRRPAVIQDIYADSRIPADAYRPTFVKSLAMVPIRTTKPIGAIGNYWPRSGCRPTQKCVCCRRSPTRRRSRSRTCRTNRRWREPKISCGNHRRWRRSVGWPVVSPTTSTTSCR